MQSVRSYQTVVIGAMRTGRLRKSAFYEVEADQSDDEAVSSDEEDGGHDEYEEMSPEEVRTLCANLMSI
jgi:hypothetical protein